MSERHDETFFADARHFETVGEIFLVDYPRVISAHLKRLIQAFEEIVVGSCGDGRCHTMIDIFEVCQLSAEYFTDSLVAETHAEDGLLACKGLDDVEQQSRFTWDARPRGDGRGPECAG